MIYLFVSEQRRARTVATPWLYPVDSNKPLIRWNVIDEKKSFKWNKSIGQRVLWN